MPRSGAERSIFRKCDCGESWKTRNAFLRDKHVKIVGYQPDLISHKYNHFLFQHKAKGCGRFFGVRASDFSDLRQEKCANELCMGQAKCPGYCLNTLDLRVCSVTCRNASDRVLASKIRNRRILRNLKAAIAGVGVEKELRKSF